MVSMQVIVHSHKYNLNTHENGVTTELDIHKIMFVYSLVNVYLIGSILWSRAVFWKIYNGWLQSEMGKICRLSNQYDLWSHFYAKQIVQLDFMMCLL